MPLFFKIFGCREFVNNQLHCPTNQPVMQPCVTKVNFLKTFEGCPFTNLLQQAAQL